MLGYESRTERFRAFGETSFTGDVLEPTRPLDSMDYWWQSIRVGARSEIPLGWGLAARVAGFMLPHISLELAEVVHGSDTIAPSPGRVYKGDGWGGELDVGLGYTVWKGLSVAGGFHYWHAAEGSLKQRFFDAVPRGPMEATSERYGPYFGLQYRW